MNFAQLAWSYLRARPLGTLLNVLLLALGVGTIGFVLIVDGQIGDSLNRDAKGIDLVVAIDSVQVNSPDELMRRVTTRRPGTAAELLWLRNDREFRATVALGSTPDSVIAATLESATRSSGARGPEIEAELRRLEREVGPATHPPLRPQR